MIGAHGLPALLLSGMAALGARAGTVLYVDDGAAAGGDGLAWESAYRFLQDALAFASNPASGVSELRVAQGVYRPDRSEASPGGTGNRNAAFILPSGVLVDGGYAGGGAPDPDERDVEFYESVLSGDLAGDDAPDFGNIDDNSFHVVNGSLTPAGTVLDGFTIRGGNASTITPTDSHLGGGMYNFGGALSLVRCTFESNTAIVAAAVYSTAGANVTVTDCAFIGNAATTGGAFYNRQSTAALAGCLFAGNTAAASAGAFYSTHQGEATLAGCEFDGNVALDGGAVFAVQSSLAFSQCTFTDNAATAQTGGAVSCSGNVLSVTGCTFSGNAAQGSGGAVNCFCNAASVTASTFSGNTSSASAGGAVHHSAGTIEVACCTFENNAAVAGGGLSAGSGLAASSAMVTDCSFTGNSASGWGGAIRLGSVGGPWTVANCRLIGNTADRGGGIAGDAVELVSSVLAGNGAVTSGGAMFLWDPDGFADAVVTNCTLYANVAGDAAGGVHVLESSCTIMNSILWGNSDPGGTGEGAQVSAASGATAEVGFSCVQGLSGFPECGNIGGNPQFVDPDGPDGVAGNEDDDLHLADGSPCIGAANQDFVPEGWGSDFDGEKRTQQCRVDMGADETPFPGADCNGDGAGDACEADCDSDGVPDGCQVAGGLSPDCNGNGVPDGCETDCDGNGVPDECDIVAGSPDCNGNGVPDPCDLQPTFTAVSERLWPIGWASPQSYTLVSPPLAAGEVVTFTITAVADLGSPFEALGIELNGALAGSVFGSGGTDCPTAPETEQLLVSAAFYDAALALTGSDMVIGLVPVQSVDEALCVPCSVSFATVAVEYESAAPASVDKNGNGVPDECDCPWDLDGDGQVAVGDLLMLLAAWGTDPGGPPDFNGDGDVDVTDLLAQLSNWYSCPG